MGIQEADIAVIQAETQGIGTTFIPSFKASLTKAYQGSEIQGVQASETKATDSQDFKISMILSTFEGHSSAVKKDTAAEVAIEFYIMTMMFMAFELTSLTTSPLYAIIICPFSDIISNSCNPNIHRQAKIHHLRPRD